MQPSIRCFIAVEIPGEIQKSLIKVIANANLTPVNGFRPVRPGMIHITLKFLGDTPLLLIHEVQQGLSDIVLHTQPFEILVNNVGAFSSWDRPRTIWAGLLFPPDLKDLASRIDQMCISLDFPAEKRPFSPHLTLARVSDQPDRELIKRSMKQLSQFQKTEFGKITVTGVTLFQSTLGIGGSIYTPLSFHKFGL